MLQIIGLLTISWLLIWFFEKGNLAFLGLIPTKTQFKYAVVLFFVTAFISAATFGLRSYFLQEVYILSPSNTAQGVLLNSWYQFRSVLTEELLFRGVLLYILIKKIGSTKGILISSVLFALMHWINPGVWGNIPQMATVFIYTFAMGLLLAFAYAKTFSLLAPFAIHFGWNLTQNYIFPENLSGNHLFILAEQPMVTISYIIFFALFILPKLTVLIINYLIIKHYACKA